MIAHPYEEMLAGMIKVWLESANSKVSAPPEEHCRRLLDAALSAITVCCEMHNEHCEPPAELCCWMCSEANHPDHPAGMVCVLAVVAT